MTLFLTIPATIEGLEEAAELICPEDMPVIEAIRLRVEREHIRQEYRQMRKEGVKPHHAINQLHEKYKKSHSTIEGIVYRT